jgi:hypothetical protein
MAITRKEEERALDKDERDLVAKSHHPEIQELADKDLSDIVGRLRQARDKARTESHRQRREMRGKSAPKGQEPAASNKGTQRKLDVLAMAMRRVNKETERRRRMGTNLSLVESANRALQMKKKAEDPAPDFNTRTAHKGMRDVRSERRQNLVRPMELGRQRKAGAVAQARRDSKG